MLRAKQWMLKLLHNWNDALMSLQVPGPVQQADGRILCVLACARSGPTSRRTGHAGATSKDHVKLSRTWPSLFACSDTIADPHPRSICGMAQRPSSGQAVPRHTQSEVIGSRNPCSAGSRLASSIAKYLYGVLAVRLEHLHQRQKSRSA